MGKRGPAPTPTALKVVNGTRKSRINAQEPQPAPLDGVPEPPDWLTEVGKRYWRDLAPQMMSRGVLTGFDVHGFAVLCQAFDLHQRASELLNGAAIVTDGEKGKVRNIALMVQRDCAATIKSWSQEFGLTPSARSGIRLPQPATPDEARRLLS